MDFTTYLIRLSHTPLTEAAMALYEASEGDARKYMKKVLISLGLEHELADEYGENWSELIFKKLRKEFIRLGCDMYFLPGLARILYGELDFDSDDEDTEKTATLRDLVRFITLAHKGQFTRNLELINVVQDGPQKGMKVKSEPLSFKQLVDMFAKAADDMDEAEQDAWEKANAGKPDNGYKIIELTDFDTAHKFYPYTVTDDPQTAWCYLETEDTFESYSKDGNRLYLAVKPGFENLKPGDPGYGNSMIGFDMGPVKKTGKSRLCVSTNRYNHGFNLETEEQGHGDNEFDQISLSNTLGLPVWRACPGHSFDSILTNPRVKHLSTDMIMELFPTYREMKNKLDDMDGIGYEILRKFNLGVNSPKLFHNLDIIDFRQHYDYRDWHFFAIVDKDKPDQPAEWFKSFDEVCPNITVLRMAPHGYKLIDVDGNFLFNGTLFKYVELGSGYPVLVQRYEDNKYGLILDDGKLTNNWYDDAFNFYGNVIVEKTLENGKTISNVLNGKGESLIGEWATELLKKDLFPIGEVFKVTFIDGLIGLYTYEFNPLTKERFDSVEFNENNSFVVVQKNGKYSLFNLHEQNGGQRIWFDKIAPMGKVNYYWQVWLNGKINFICNGSLISNTWFDGDSIPAPEQHLIHGLKLNGKPVVLGINDQFYGKIYSDTDEDNEL